MSNHVEIFEVGPRDGLQNEAQQITVAEKIAMVECLSGGGFKRIQVASLVSPKWVPQMAQSGDGLAGIQRAAGVSYLALTPNLCVFTDALGAKADEVAIFTSASEGFSQANVNISIDNSLNWGRDVAQAAEPAELPVRGYIPCVTKCPYDGLVDSQRVLCLAAKLLDMGCYEISLCDTIGRATPPQIEALLTCLYGDIGAARLAGRYHDTGGQAWANVPVSLAHGMRVFDAAIGGLGGCTYAPGVVGNIATEKLHRSLMDLGYDTGLMTGQIDKVAAMSRAMPGDEINV